MERTLIVSAVSLVVYMAMSVPTIITLNNLVNRSQENRLNVQRADINKLKERVDELSASANRRSP